MMSLVVKVLIFLVVKMAVEVVRAGYSKKEEHSSFATCTMVVEILKMKLRKIDLHAKMKRRWPYFYSWEGVLVVVGPTVTTLDPR